MGSFKSYFSALHTNKHAFTDRSSSTVWPFRINLPVSAPCLCDRYLWICNTSSLIWSQRSPFISWQCKLFLSFLPTGTQLAGQSTQICTLSHSFTRVDTFCCSFPQITSTGGEAGGVEQWGPGSEMALLSKWSRANEFISETDGPKPFRIKLGHSKREQEEADSRRKRHEGGRAPHHKSRERNRERMLLNSFLPVASHCINVPKLTFQVVIY